MFYVWWDISSAVYHEILNQKKIVNAELFHQLEAIYKKLLKRAYHWLIVKMYLSHTILQDHIISKTLRK